MRTRKPTPPATGAGATGSKARGTKASDAKTPRFTSGKVSVLDLPAEPWLQDFQDDPEDAGSTVIAFPEPTRRRRRRYWILGVTGLVLAVAGLLAYLIFSPALALRTVEVQGNTLVSTVEATAALDPLLGVSLTQITDEDVASLLEGFAPVEDVVVSAVPPSTLAVTIRERVPVAILQSSERFLLIDAEGQQLASVQDRESVQLPLIDGGTDAVNSEVFSSITTVLAALPESILGQLEHASAESVDSIELSLTDDREIFWGSAEDNGSKALVLEALLGAPAADPPVKVYDVSTPTRPVTR